MMLDLILSMLQSKQSLSHFMVKGDSKFDQMIRYGSWQTHILWPFLQEVARRHSHTSEWSLELSLFGAIWWSDTKTLICNSDPLSYLILTLEIVYQSTDTYLMSGWVAGRQEHLQEHVHGPGVHRDPGGEQDGGEHCWEISVWGDLDQWQTLQLPWLWCKHSY